LARFLALDADSSRIQVVSANIKGSSLKLEKAMLWAEDPPLGANNAAEIGRRLAEKLHEAGIAPAPLLVSVGRDRVILKDVKIPPVAPHEEPAVVRNQARREFTESGADVAIDYVPLGDNGNGTEHKVLIVSLRREVLQTYTTMAEAAGLKLVGVTPRPFAFYAGLQRAISAGEVPPPEPVNSAIGVLVRGEKWGEFAIFRDGRLVVARSLAAPTVAGDTALLGDLRRNLAIHATHMPDAPVKAIYLAEPDSPLGLRERLQEALEIPVHCYEPLIGVAAPDGPRGGLTAAAGLLALRADTATLPINFVQPREPKPPRSANQSVVIALGALAAAVILGFIGVGTMMVMAKDKKIAEMQKNKNDIDNLVRTHDTDLKIVRGVDEWSATDINWLDELYDFTARMDGSMIQKINVMDLNASPLEEHSAGSVAAAPANAKTKFVAKMALKLITTDDEQPLTKLRNELNTDKQHYRIPAFSVKANTGRDRQRFRREYSGTIDIAKRKPEDYILSFTATPPKRQTDEGAGMFEGGFPAP
jgi:Tfp pilus assembly PilM family ATPase